jgi:gluconate 2-dehydrogenase gamma chain
LLWSSGFHRVGKLIGVAHLKSPLATLRINMPEHGASRRVFLVRAALGAGFVTAGGLASEASAQHEGAAVSDAQRSEGHGAFFNLQDASTIIAFTERLMPGEPGKPGALQAGVLNYIDLALAGAYADLQDFYRRGLAQLDAYCKQTYRETFVRLSAAQQGEVIAALEKGQASGFAWPRAQAFFETVRTHTMEGMFADPIYGGNHDFAGWHLVGFPGAQAIFTTADMESRVEFDRASIVGLQSQGAPRRG